jgi:hypothetical protein
LFENWKSEKVFWGFRDWKYSATFCHFLNATLPLVNATFCHFLPLCHFATLPLCHFATLPLSATLPLCHFATLPLSLVVIRNLYIISRYNKMNERKGNEPSLILQLNNYGFRQEVLKDVL